MLKHPPALCSKPNPIFPRAILACVALLAACGDDPFTSSDCGDTTGRPVFELVGEFFYADWGPDDRLAVVHVPVDSSGEYLHDQGGIFTMRTDGSDLRRVLLVEGAVAAVLSLDWSPDGKWIAFDSGGQLFKVSADGDSLVQLTHDERSKYSPSWSPDGRWIAYQVPYGEFKYRGLWAVSADGSEQFQFTRPPPEQMCLECGTGGPGSPYGEGPSWEVQDPAWSPRGKEVAYAAFENRVGTAHLAIYDTTTARVQFIHEAESTIYAPRFSPDGSTILFVTSSRDIWVVNRDGTAPRRIGAEGENPNWSPDGRQVVYRRYTFEYCRYQDPGYGELWMMNADGSGQRQITFSKDNRQEVTP